MAIERFTGEEWRYRRGTWERDGGCGRLPPPLPSSNSSNKVTREDVFDTLGTVGEMLVRIANNIGYAAAVCASKLRLLLAFALRFALWVAFRGVEIARAALGIGHTFLGAVLEVEAQYGGGAKALVGSTQQGEQDATVDDVLTGGAGPRARLGDGVLTGRVLGEEVEREQVRRS